MRPLFALSTLFVCLLGAAAMGADDAASLLKVIQSTETSDVDRANAFEKIGDIAGEDAVEPLAGFLGDKKWSHYARFALQKMEGENVTEALLKSLDDVAGRPETRSDWHDRPSPRPDRRCAPGKAPRGCRCRSRRLGRRRPGMDRNDGSRRGTHRGIWRRERSQSQSVPRDRTALGRTTAREDGKHASCDWRFRSSAKCGNPESLPNRSHQNAILARGAQGVDLMVEQLKSSDPHCFQTGLAVSRVLPGERVTQGLIDSLETESSPHRQVLLILAMKDRGDNLALRAVLPKLKSDSPAVRSAAIDAIGALGDESSVPTLLSVANGATTEAVLGALVALDGGNVNAALMKAAQPPGTSTVAVQALGKRRAKEAVDLLFELSAADSSEISQEAILALGMTSPQDRFLDLLALLKTAKSDTQKTAIQGAVNGAIFRSPQPDDCAEALGAMIPISSGADREFLFEQMRIAGGARAVALDARICHRIGRSSAGRRDEDAWCLALRRRGSRSLAGRTR